MDRVRCKRHTHDGELLHRTDNILLLEPLGVQPAEVLGAASRPGQLREGPSCVQSFRQDGPVVGPLHRLLGLAEGRPEVRREDLKDIAVGGLCQQWRYVQTRLRLSYRSVSWSDLSSGVPAVRGGQRWSEGGSESARAAHMCSPAHDQSKSDTTQTFLGAADLGHSGRAGEEKTSGGICQTKSVEEGRAARRYGKVVSSISIGSHRRQVEGSWSGPGVMALVVVSLSSLLFFCTASAVDADWLMTTDKSFCRSHVRKFLPQRQAELCSVALPL